MQQESNLRALRLALVDADRSLHECRDRYTVLLGRLLRDVKIKSTTKEARDVEIAGLFADNAGYLESLNTLHYAEYTRDRAEALLEAAKDERRAAEWQIRCKLADALFSRSVQSDADDPTGDGAFDDASFGAVIERLSALASDKHETYRHVAQDMINTYNTGMADRINGAGEYVEDDLPW